MRFNTCRIMAAAWMSKMFFGMDPSPKVLLGKLGELGELGGDEVDDLWRRIASGGVGVLCHECARSVLPCRQ